MTQTLKETPPPTPPGEETLESMVEADVESLGKQWLVVGKKELLNTFGFDQL